MPPEFMLHFVMPLLLGVMSLAFIAIGLYALIRRRPFVISARWLLALLGVAFLPQFILPLSWSFDKTSTNGWLNGAFGIQLLTMVVVFGFVALQMRGYMVFGTTQESFRDAVLSALSKLNLESMTTAIVYVVIGVLMSAGLVTLMVAMR